MPAERLAPRPTAGHRIGATSYKAKHKPKGRQGAPYKRHRSMKAAPACGPLLRMANPRARFHLSHHYAVNHG